MDLMNCRTHPFPRPSICFMDSMNCRTHPIPLTFHLFYGFNELSHPPIPQIFHLIYGFDELLHPHYSPDLPSVLWIPWIVAPTLFPRPSICFMDSMNCHIHPFPRSSILFMDSMNCCTHPIPQTFHLFYGFHELSHPPYSPDLLSVLWIPWIVASTLFPRPSICFMDSMNCRTHPIPQT